MPPAGEQNFSMKRLLCMGLTLLLTSLALAAPNKPAPAHAGAVELQTSPVPRGFVPVTTEDGSITYSGESELHKRLVASHIRLLVIRHGQSESNARPGVFLYGRTESPLTALGLEQAHICGKSLYGVLGGDEWAKACGADSHALPVFFSSPLGRAKETAEALSQELLTHLKPNTDVEISLDPRLIETNFGDLETHPLSDLERDYPQFLTHWRPPAGLGTDYTHRFPGGESRADVMLRMANLLDWINKNYAGRTVVLVSHSECLLAAQALLGLAPVIDGKLRAETSTIPNATPVWLIGAPSTEVPAAQPKN